jgi:hypothetical protein
MKAIAAFLVAFGGAYLTATQDNHVTGNEWVTAAIMGLTALGAVWAVPNAPKKTEPGE